MIRSIIQVINGIDFKIYFLLALIWTACQGDPAEKPSAAASYVIPELFKDSAYQVFVETPIGSTMSFTYDIERGVFDTVNKDGDGAYLPYPLNYGFFPVKSNDTIKKMPVWVLGKRLPQGTTLAVQLLGLVEYVDRNLTHREWLVVPQEKSIQTVHSTQFRDFIILHDPVKFTFEYWLKNRHGTGSVSQIVWYDEEKALTFLQEEINK